MKFMIKNVIQSIFSRACKSRFLARIIFGLDFQPVGKDDYYFDVTTLALIRRAGRSISRSSRVVDMGAGAVSVIGLTLWKRLGCNVIASDINPDIVALAQANIDRNKAPIRVINSSFFDNIDEDFDTVIFNPPYLPRKTGLSRHSSEKRRSQWDGGSDGTEVIENFLDAFQKLDHQADAYMGMNFWHIPREKLIGILDSRKAILVKEIYRHPILPVDVYILCTRP